jgi:SAM-dependent methyltransferase
VQEKAFFKKLLDEGIDAVGLDFNDYAISKFNPNIAQHLIKGDILKSIDTIINSGAKYEVVFVNHFLEHATRPELFLLKLKNILTSPGYVMISVPNDFSELQRELKIKGYYSKDYFIKYPDNLHYFNADSLKNLLNEIGFQFLDGIADFPIEWFIANPHSNYARAESLGKGAHNARIFLETLINQKNKMLALQFWRSLFNLGQGRSIAAIFEFQGNK